MTKDSPAPAANQMLGSQLVNKSIIRSPSQTTSGKQHQQQQQQQAPTSSVKIQQQKQPTESSNIDSKSPTSPTAKAASFQAHHHRTKSPPISPTRPQEHPIPATQIPKGNGSKKSPELKQTTTTVITATTGDGSNQQQQQQHVVSANNAAAASSSAKELQILAKEAQDLKAKTRKLQLEVDEKNEIINVLKDELETLREQNDKYHRDSIQLIKDSKRVKFLQDENDFLQDKVGQVEILELEIKRLKERLNETEFFKLRVSELEEDLTKLREESNQFEDNWRQAESKLTRVAELETELNKWKSFSHELELEKNSIQTKLLESIDNETKLNSDNKKVEDEVRRLRDLIKSYEEQRDEEQASNSLIMSVADLKQLDNQHQQQENEKLLLETGTNTESNTVQEMGQQTDTSDTAEKSCETDNELQQQQQVENHNLQALNTENESLKEELKRQEVKLNDLVDSNKQIFNELDGNRRLISDLRQDLACEKSLTQKLTTQLTSFTKQIKSLDKQYFPMHDTTTTTTTATAKTTAASTTIAQKQKIDSDQQRSVNRSKLTEDVDWKQKSSPAAAPALTPTQNTKNKEPNGLMGTVSGTDILSKISSPVHHVNGLKEELPLPVDESQQDQLAKKKVTTTTIRPSANPNLNDNESGNIGCIDKQSLSESNEVHVGEEKDECLNGNKKATATHVKAYRAPERDNKSSNFVRNSIPSRSVNFGHSKSSTHLDRIRASVTATATTSSSNTSATSFNEQTTTKITQGLPEQQILNRDSTQKPGFVLNCMLNHQHSDRCFAKIDRPTRVQVSQPTQVNLIHTNPNVHLDHLHHHQQQQHQISNHLAQFNHHQANHQATTRATSVAPSRQLNALIDPLADEQLFMSLLQQQIVAQQQSGLPSAAQPLSEQQIAHLNNLQRQHYYHHLHQLHQIHHLHQLHHLHHKCQQQQHQQQQQQQQHRNQHASSQQQKANSGGVGTAPSSAADLHANMVGSQFYAPSYDQVYANMVANNNSNQSTEHRVQRQNGTRLVNNDSELGATAARQQQQEYKRSSPQRAAPPSSDFGPRDTIKKTNNQLGKQQRQPLLPPNQSPNASAIQRPINAVGGVTSQQRQQQSSPTLSSPNSSRTSNISPSSEASSSSSTSSTNSLSTSVPLTRSALRHTATDLSRRQYSVERELINSTPLTATLSRVGSCRGMPSNHYHHLASQQQQQQQPTSTAPKDINSLMRNPVQSQQPPMRTSKILNIGSQQQTNASTTTAPGTIDSSQLAATLCKEMKKAPTSGANGIVDSFNRPTTNSMANIKLNDNLAFASLRVPKKSSSGSNLNASLIAAAAAAAATNGRSINSRVSSSASGSPDKARLMKVANTNSSAGKQSNIGSSSNNNNGHSSVWYEYGCI